MTGRLLIALCCAALGASILATPTLAQGTCAADMKSVEAALLTAKLDAGTRKKVDELRSAGETAQKSNKVGDCLKAMGEAKKLLGVK